MRIVVYLPLLSAVLLAAGAPWLARRLHPATATWLLVVAGTVVAASTTLTLALLAWTIIVEIPAVAAIGPWSAQAWEIHNPVPDSVAVIALTALILVLCLLIETVTTLIRRSLRARRALSNLEAGQGELVIVDDTGLEAFTVPYPRKRGRIVVSTGMLRALSAQEQRALIAHEQAHLRHRHHLHRALAAVACALNPILWPLGPAVDFATERWADEQAAHAVNDRRLVARALARAALARHKAHTPAHPADLHYDRLDVPERVRRMMESRPRSRPMIIAVMAALLLLTLTAVNEASEDSDHLLDRVEMNPHHNAAPDLVRRGG
ncbi:M48 family metalloprotease [Nonomuraea sp. NPDC049784]|uniref:M48 family metalloprotease n=1 Tax=Nonomuraea sp. NPDC049784 TaxID=3154361 RepID=UPI0033CD3DB6